MNSGYMIIYKKSNDDIIYRTTKNRPMYRKGEITSMGWQVLDIQYLYKGNAYSYLQYEKIINKRKKILNIRYYLNTNLVNILKIITLLLVIYVILQKNIFL